MNARPVQNGIECNLAQKVRIGRLIPSRARSLYILCFKHALLFIFEQKNLVTICHKHNYLYSLSYFWLTTRKGILYRDIIPLL